MARERIEAARAVVGRSGSSGASLAYYAMLNAARAALSEEDKNARTHKGTWDLFHEAFVATGRIDPELAHAARATQRTREAADYDARAVPQGEAQALVTLAERFVAAVDEALAA